MIAAVLAAVIMAVVVYALTASGSPAKRVAAIRPTTTATAPTATTPPTTAATTTATTPAPARREAVNNFTVPFYGNQASRSRDFIERADLNPPFKLAWQLGGNALLEFPATIWGNNLYYFDDGATAKRVNISTGKLIWQRHVGLLSASSPALDVKRKIMFVSVLSLTGDQIGDTDGEVAALSMRSGKILWTYPVASGTESSPMVVGNSVYFGDQGGTLTSLNVVSGKVNWTFSTDGSIKAAPAYQDGNLYFGTYGGSFYAVNAASGHEVWSASPGGEFYSTPAIAFGHVFVGNNDDDVYAYDLGSGALAWDRSVGGYAYSGPAAATIPGLGPTVFIGSYDGDLYALNAQTGSTDWAASVGAISGSATVVDNTVYVSTVYEKGSYGFNARTGQQVFYFPDGSYTTVLADRSAVFLMGKYTLYKLVPRGARLRSSARPHRGGKH